MHQLLAVRQARRPAPHFRAVFLSLFLLTLAWSLPAAAQVTIQPTTIPNPVQGSAYNQQMTASGGTAPYTYTVSSGGLPPGLFYNTSGLIYGTPTTQGTYTFTFGAYDGTAAFGSRSYTVTVQPPAVAGPTATIVIADTALAASETTTVTITFSTAVTGFATVDLTVANGVVSGLASSDGGTTWTATLTPTAGINDPSNVIVLDNAGVTNAGGTPGSGTTTSNNYAIDTQRPTATVVVADTALAAGETSTVTFTFSEAVTGFSNADLTVANGSLSAVSSADGGTTWTATLTPTANQTDPTNLITLANTGVSDAAGNTGTGSTNSNNYAVDTFRPTATLVVADTSLTAGETSLVTIGFNEAVSGFAIADLTVANGSVSALSSADGGITWTATLTPVDSLSDPTNVITLANTGVQDAAGNAGIGSTDSNNYAIDTFVAPTAADLGGVAVPYNDSGTAIDLSASITGVHSSIAIGTAPANGTALVAGDVVTYTPTTGHAGADSFTFTATGPGGTSAPATVSITVGDPVLAITGGGPSAGTVAAAYSQTFTFSGGSAPYTAGVSGLPAGVGVSAGTADSVTVSGTPTQSGNFTISVSGTDSSTGSGPFSLTQDFPLTIAAPTLALAPGASTFNADYNTAFNQVFTASGGTGPHTYTLTGTLPAGVNFSGDTLSGTPTASGSFGFTVTATDSSTGAGAPFSVTVAYTLDVTAATIVLTPASLPDGTAGTAYGQTLVATGGIGPYSFALTGGSLPAGVNLAADGTLGGTPTVAGSFNFTVEATDANGQTGSRAYTLVTSAPVLAISRTVLPGGVVGTAYQESLVVSGNTAPYSFAITGGALPAGLALSGDGTISGTPTTAGDNGFTVTATDTLGFTVAGTFNIGISEAVPVAADDSATTLSEQPVSVAATANDAGVISSIAIASAPANGTALVNGLALDYTPAAGFSGEDSFTYTASGPGGTSAPATVTITVNPVPVAVSREVTVLPATPVLVELTEGATGGPFTDATLVALTPAGSGTATVAAAGSGYVLEYTPAADFTGVALARFTLTNAHATSAVATITFTVEPRPDPTEDAEVQGLLDAQVESAQRFATSQIGNFQQRLQQLRNGGGSGASNGIGFATDSRCLEQPLQPRSLSGACDLAYGQDGLPTAPLADAGETGAQDPGSRFGFWTGGMVRSGSQDGRDGNADISFETDGISAGVDYRLNDAFAFGAGIGWGGDENEVGGNGSFVDGDATSFVVYASYDPEGRWFVDGLLGYQRLSYDLKRYLTGTGGFVRGERDGDQWFGSVSTGADIGWKTMQFTPYARLDLARGTLDGYTESGHPILALRYGDVDLETSTGNLGLHLQFFNESVHGRFVPQLRIEYQHDFNGRSGGTVQYADLASGPLFLLESSDYGNNRWIFGAGAQLQTFNNWLIGLEYRGQVGSSGETDNGVLLKLQKDL